MTSDKQILANRRNAKLSTGPASPEGKATSSRNALKHGLTAVHSVTVGRDERPAFAEHRSLMMDDLQPDGAMEENLAERIAVLTFRLSRVGLIESQLLGHHGGGYMQANPVGTGFSRAARDGDPFSKLSRYEVNLERQLWRAMDRLQSLQASRRGDRSPTPPVLALKMLAG